MAEQIPGPRLVVAEVGALVLVQDLGRPGHASLGVPASGAADRRALRLANRLVGNPEGAAALEVLLGGLVLRATEPVTLAVTGAPLPVTVDGRPAALFEPVKVGAGQTLALGRPVHGLRSYVAVRGGLETERSLGSASTDLTSGLGPPPVQAGQALEVGSASVDVVRSSELAATHGAGRGDVVLRAVLGPRDDWFTEEAVRLLGTTAWAVTHESDRVGVRLSGPSLSRARSGELASEGVVRGAVQVPASGQPLVFFADHPTTGGYPVLAVVVDEDTDRLAQARPGDRIRFQLGRAAWL